MDETNGDNYRQVTDQHEGEPLLINRIINNWMITFVGRVFFSSVPMLLILDEDCG